MSAPTTTAEYITLTQLMDNASTPMTQLFLQKGKVTCQRLTATKLVAASFPALPQADREPVKRALLIVCEHPKGGWTLLPGARIDLVLWLVHLLNAGFEIAVITDIPTLNEPFHGASKPKIKEHMIGMVDGNQNGDQFVVIFVGHGSNIMGEQAMVAADGQTIATSLMHKLLISPLVEGVSLLAIFNCCHSPNMLNLPFELKNDLQRGLLTNRTSVAKNDTKASIICIGASAGLDHELILTPGLTPYLTVGSLTWALHAFQQQARDQSRSSFSVLENVMAVVTDQFDLKPGTPPFQYAQYTCSQRTPPKTIPLLSLAPVSAKVP